MSDITFEQLVDAILDGVADENISALNGAIKKRRELINGKKMLFLSPGDTVKFNSSTRPKYLQGLLAEVTRVNKTTVTVKINDADSRARRYAFGEFRTPISLVDKVNV